MTASLKSEETSQDENVSQGNQIVQKRFLFLDYETNAMYLLLLLIFVLLLIYM